MPSFEYKNRNRFRLWDNENKEMYYKNIEYLLDNGVFKGTTNYEIMQRTGFGINDIAVFELDILILDTGEYGIVVWDDYYNDFEVWTAKTGDALALREVVLKRNIKILGNIYEKSSRRTKEFEQAREIFIIMLQGIRKKIVFEDRFKCRLWNKIIGNMEYKEFNEISLLQTDYSPLNPNTFMPCTGFFLDGELLYELDILEIQRDRYGLVLWSNKENDFVVYLSEIGDFISLRYCMEMYPHELNPAANMYEPFNTSTISPYAYALYTFKNYLIYTYPV